MKLALFAALLLAACDDPPPPAPDPFNECIAGWEGCIATLQGITETLRRVPAPAEEPPLAQPHAYGETPLPVDLPARLDTGTPIDFDTLLTDPVQIDIREQWIDVYVGRKRLDIPSWISESGWCFSHDPAEWFLGWQIGAYRDECGESMCNLGDLYGWGFPGDPITFTELETVGDKLVKGAPYIAGYVCGKAHP